MCGVCAVAALGIGNYWGTTRAHTLSPGHMGDWGFVSRDRGAEARGVNKGTRGGVKPKPLPPFHCDLGVTDTPDKFLKLQMLVGVGE